MGKILIIFALFFLTCGTDSNKKYVQMYPDNAFVENSGKRPYQIVEIDSCEYVYVQNGNASWGSHKGNCKFCAERLKNKTMR